MAPCECFAVCCALLSTLFIWVCRRWRLWWWLWWWRYFYVWVGGGEGGKNTKWQRKAPLDVCNFAMFCPPEQRDGGGGGEGGLVSWNRCIKFWCCSERLITILFCGSVMVVDHRPGKPTVEEVPWLIASVALVIDGMRSEVI